MDITKAVKRNISALAQYDRVLCCAAQILALAGESHKISLSAKTRIVREAGAVKRSIG